MLYVSVISVLTFSCLLFFYSYVFYQQLRPSFTIINDNYQSAQSTYDKGGIVALKTWLSALESNDKTDRLYYILLDDAGEKIAGNLMQWPTMHTRWGKYHSINIYQEDGIHNLSARVIESDGYRLMLAYSIDKILASIKLLALALSQFMLGVIVIGFIGALVVSYDSMRRVNAVNDSIQTIMNGDLSERVATRRSDGEFYVLATNANTMLDRIQELLIGMRQFSNNIAHDLRTPLTRLRNNLELLSERADASNSKIVSSLIAEADGLLATFNAVLRIAQIETEASRKNFSDLNLATILQDIIELYEPLANDKNIILSAEKLKDGFIDGDKDMLFQLFANLLDNAIKYSPPNTCIVLRCAYRLGFVKVSITDQGMGIPEHEKKKVFDRFYRVEHSRSLKPGNGLGLSLVSAVVDLHQAMIALSDNHPGLRVEVTFRGSR